jgi:seryl-tRNA synthetase
MKERATELLRFWPLVAVFVSGVVAWTRMESTVNTMEARYVEKIRSIELEMLEKEKLANERINNVAKDLKEAITYLNEEDDGVKGDLQEAVKALKELHEQRFRYLESK